MSSEWEFFPCTIGDSQAFIFVDIGIGKQIAAAPSTLVKVRLKYKHTHPNGLPTDQDYQPAVAVENALESIARQGDDWYVGRITMQGYRYFYVYSAQPEQAWEDHVRRLASESGFEIEYSVREDAQHAAYSEELYPTADDWRVIADMRVIDALAQQGDPGTQVRLIDHWVYLPEEQVGAFVQWALLNQFSYSEASSEPCEDGRMCIRIQHHGTVQLADISHRSISLRRKAEELGGEYDGWETPCSRIESGKRRRANS